jgi:hypothetical protein
MQAPLDSVMAIAGQNAPQRMLKKSDAHLLPRGVSRVGPWQISKPLQLPWGISTPLTSCAL